MCLGCSFYSFDYPKHVLKLMGNKIFTTLCSKILIIKTYAYLSKILRVNMTLTKSLISLRSVVHRRANIFNIFYVALSMLKQSQTNYGKFV